MAYNTKAIKKDVDGKPIPQVFNPTLDEYEALKGDAGAARHVIYGPDGNPITTTGNKLAVRASEIETQLTAIQGYIDGIEGTLATLATASNQAATQTTLAAILAKIIAAPSTEAKQDALAALIGEVDADPTANSLLARLKSLEDKIDKITSGETPATTQLSGSIESVTAAPLTGVKTVTATAAEVFAGGSVKANRRMLAIRNDDPALRCRIGKSDVTQQTGFPIEPGATVHIQFDPATAVAFYAISEGAALSISVLEV